MAHRTPISTPLFPTIVEPFAGSAGYAMRYPDRRIVLVDIDPTIAAIWRFLIGATERLIREIPLVDDVADLPRWCSDPGLRALVGFSMNAATTTPRKTLSAGARRLRDRGRRFYGWSADLRERCASQVGAIRHWQIIEGNYTEAPDVEATWMIDSPYQQAGVHYRFGSRLLDYAALGAWTTQRRGQIIACEAQDASWLPFRPLANVKAGPRSKHSAEAVWIRES